MKSFRNNIALRVFCVLLASVILFGLVGCKKKYKDPTAQFVAALDSVADDVLKNADKNSGTAPTLGLDTLNGKKIGIVIQPVLSETLGAMLGEELPLDVSVINNFKLGIDAEAKDALAGIALSLGYGKSSLITLNGILDIKKLGAYVNIAEASDKALFFDIKSMLENIDGEAINEAKNSFTVNSEEIKLLIPVLTDYYKMLYAGASDVTSFKDNFTVGSLSSEMTVLTWTASDKVVYDTVIAILEKFVADERIKPIFKQFYEGEEDVDEAYAEIVDAAKQFLELEKNDPTETTGATVLTVRLYVDKNNDIFGIDVIACDTNGTEEFNLKSGALKVGDDFAFDMTVFGEDIPKLSLAANGSNVKDVLNCTVSASYDGKQVAVLTVKDLDSSKADDGIYKGSVRLRPGSGLASLPDVDPTTAIAIGMFGLNVDFENDGNKSQYFISVEMNNANLAGINVTVENGKADAISVPSDYVTEPALWVMSLDFDKILDSIEASELPDEVVDLLFALLSEK